MGTRPFRDRSEAGRRLAAALVHFGGKDVVVLGIPRGGVVVAAEVASVLGVPIDVVVTRKIEAPGEPEYAIGAVTQEGEAIVDRQAAESLGADEKYIAAQIEQKRIEVAERVRRYRGDSPRPTLKGKTVVIVDDGIATGSSVGAAVISVKKEEPKGVVVAVPVAPRDVVEALRSDGNVVVCLEAPGHFLAIGEFYDVFDQVSDEEVSRILTRREQKSA